MSDLLDKLVKKIVYESGGNKLKIVDETDTHYFILPPGTRLEKVKKVNCFNDKMDAMYDNFVKRDKPISNYKGSKYRDYYWERAKKENPELLI